MQASLSQVVAMEYIYWLLIHVIIWSKLSFILSSFSLPLGPNTYTENETIAKYEIMDGAPVRGKRLTKAVVFAVVLLMNLVAK